MKSLANYRIKWCVYESVTIILKISTFWTAAFGETHNCASTVPCSYSSEPQFLCDFFLLPKLKINLKSKICICEEIQWLSFTSKEEFVES